jgi:hypothetical protein
MSLSVLNWYNDSKQQEVLLAAGASGLNRAVAGAYIIEKPQFAEFLSGQEIIFTTGVAIADESEITELAKASFSSGASALVLNTGMYIKNVPEDTVLFCNENNFPLFTIPWHVRIESMIQSIYNLISINDTESDNEKVKSLFESIIQKPEQYLSHADQLKELGLSSEWEYCAAIVHPVSGSGRSDSSPLREAFDRLNEYSTAKNLIFPYVSSHNIVVIFANTIPKDAEAELKNALSSIYPEKVVFCIGRSTKSIRCLNKSYNLALKILSMKLAGSIPENIVSYDELGIYKVIAALENKDILRQITDEYYKPMLDYDRLCGTDYAEFIKIYLECNGRINKISDKMFIHKNTVHYKLKKIEEILDCDLSRYDIKMYIIIAVMSS